MPERYDIDEVTRLAPSHSSAEKKEEEDVSDEDESSSDEDDEITKSSIAKMNLSGKAREFWMFSSFIRSFGTIQNFPISNFSLLFLLLYHDVHQKTSCIGRIGVS